MPMALPQDVVRPNIDSKGNKQSSRLSAILPPHSPSRLSYRAHSAKLKWEKKHGQPCPYSLPAGKGCPYVRRDDERPPLGTQHDERHNKLPERSSRAQYCDFGSGFDRDAVDSTALQESGDYLESAESTRTYSTHTPVTAAPAVGDGVPRKDEIGSGCRGNTRKNNHAIRKTPGRRRCPTLLEMHKRVIDTALLELSRPREGPFENLGDRLGGEHESFTYCYGTTSRLMKDSSSSGSLPQCAAVEQYPSTANSTGVSMRDEYGDHRPVPPNRLRAVAAVNAQARAMVLPPFREHDQWKIPLLRSGTTSGEQSAGLIGDYRFASAEYGPSAPSILSNGMPEASNPRDRLVARSAVSHPAVRSSKNVKRGRKRPGTSELAAKRARGYDIYSPANSNTVDNATGPAVDKARQTATNNNSSAIIVSPEIEEEGFTEGSAHIATKTTVVAAPERAPHPPDGFERNVAADQLVEPMTAPKDEDAERNSMIPGPNTVRIQLHREGGTEQPNKKPEERPGASGASDVRSVEDNASLGEDTSDESSGVGWTAKPVTKGNDSSNDMRDLFSLDAIESEVTADQSVDVKAPANNDSIGSNTQHLQTSSVVCERLDEERQNQSATAASSAVAQRCIDNAISQGVRAQLATVVGLEVPVPPHGIAVNTELEGTRVEAGVVANTPSVVEGQCVTEAGLQHSMPTQFAVALSDNLSAATYVENQGEKPMETVLASESRVTAEQQIARQCIDEVVVTQGTQSKLAFGENISTPQAEADDTEDARASLFENVSKGTSEAVVCNQPKGDDVGRGDLDDGGSGDTTPALSTESSSTGFELDNHSSTEVNIAAAVEGVSRQNEEISVHEAEADNNHPSALEKQASGDSRVDAARQRHPAVSDAMQVVSTTTVEESINQAIALVGSSSTNMEGKESKLPYQALAVSHANTGREQATACVIAALVEEWVWGAINTTAKAAAPSFPLMTADLPASSAHTIEMATTEPDVPVKDTVCDGEQYHAIGPPPFVAPALPPGFLEAIVAGRGSLKPTPSSFQEEELAEDESTEVRLREEERAEAEIKDRTVELRVLADLVRSEGFDRYSSEAFSRGVLYGEGKHSVVYRAESANSVGAREEEESVECRLGAADAGPATATERAAVRTTARKTTQDIVLAAVAGAMTEALTSAALKPFSASVLSGNVVASTVASAVSLVVEASTTRRQRSCFAAKEFRYAGQEVPLSILRHARREIGMHVRVRGCDRIVELHGVWLSPRVTLVLEDMNAGSLHQFIRARNTRCDERGQYDEERNDRLAAGMTQLVADVADALVTLHSAGIVHRDVKSHNVMMVSRRSQERFGSSDRGGNYYYNGIGTDRTGDELEWGSKLGDLGSAALVPTDGEAVLTEEAGTSGWVAPEVRSFYRVVFVQDYFI